MGSRTRESSEWKFQFGLEVSVRIGSVTTSATFHNVTRWVHTAEWHGGHSLQDRSAVGNAVPGVPGSWTRQFHGAAPPDPHKDPEER